MKKLTLKTKTNATSKSSALKVGVQFVGRLGASPGLYNGSAASAKAANPTVKLGQSPSRDGFTLIELLLVIAIMAVLATMSLGLMASATEDAKVSATQSRIAKIEALMQFEMDDYEVRRLPFNTSALGAFVGANPHATGAGYRPGVQLRNLRRRIVAELINAEMPSASNTDLGQFPTPDFRTWLQANYSNPVGAITLESYLLAPQFRPSGVEYWNRFGPLVNLPSEYLYEILKRIDFDGASGLESFSGSATGDTDGDGVFEIVDAFGEPMQMRVLQVIGIATANSEIWDDANTNWIVKETSGVNAGLPIGYTLLDPTVPRGLEQIRFQVFSTHLDALTF